MKVALALVCLMGALGATPAYAQTPGPPGPYVIDLRGITSGLPNAPEFFPQAAVTAFVPGRGFGVDMGAHVYLSRLGSSRLGIGLNVIRLRGTTSQPADTAVAGAAGATSAGATGAASIHATLTTVAPQVSFNFGTRSGWSYLSGGAGVGEITATALPAGLPSTRKSSGQVMAINVGGGARWFMKRRLAFGLDLRFHRFAAGAQTPGATLFAASVGVSMR